MRHLGQIQHPQLVINVFKSNNKFILKFEIGPFEQSYKFLESVTIDSFDSIRKLVTDQFMDNVISIFDQMNAHYQHSVK